MIRILPDSVANQIAAGEVVQRPASVVKELVENAVDAGGTQITIIIKDAGRTLMQIIDNGCGMSDTDARLSFERHATSKIQTADDLSHILTFGFRGEALASIASVAEVELKTRRADDEIGTHIYISASELVSQQSATCPIGSNFAIKNLFFNVPARRKFLKTDAVEFRHIVAELQRVAICHPEVAFTLISNGNEVFNLPKANLRQRLMGLFGKSVNSTLINVGVSTGMVVIDGYIGKAEDARKTGGEQFFFVNKRYFRSAYFQKAVMKAYEQLLPESSFPSFFIFFDIDPSKIDVNIHPTKTEIKFEDEQAIWQILNAAVRESLSRFAIAPAIIFDTEGAHDIPVLGKGTTINTPNVEVDTTYNPFKSDSEATTSYKKNTAPQGWESLYAGLGNNVQGAIDNFEQTETQAGSEQQTFDTITAAQPRRCLQVKSKYILTTVKSGLMIIEQSRAHRRILYERYLNRIEDSQVVSQRQLYMQHVELSPADYILVNEVMGELNASGFDIRDTGNNTIAVYACPAELNTINIKETIDDVLGNLKEDNSKWRDNKKKCIAAILAKTAAINANRTLTEQEMQHLIDSLFACAQPDICPDGKPTLTIIGMDELEKRL